ncbi:MAG: PAS domain S-box protein, partial [Candidatus Dormibacteraeota bacterium]|nr:PAS domain S-box protein [Candidatus Dormibacteraeota bacterium]
MEDSENDALVIERQIRGGGYDVEVTRVVTAEEMRAQLEGCEWDLVISDYHLPGSSLDETLAVCRADGRDIPFLLISGSAGDEAAVSAMKAGVDDYLLKESLSRLVSVIERELEKARLRGVAREAAASASRLQRALEESEKRFKTAFEYSPTGLAISGAEGRYLAVSPVLCDLLGYSEAELLGLDYFTLTHPDDRALGHDRARQLRDGELDGYRVTKRYVHRDGRVVWVDLSVTAVRDESGAVIQLISQAQDITGQKQAQDKLADSLALLEAAQEIGDIGTFVAWRIPEKLGQDEWSKACMRIFGCDERTFDGTQQAFWRRVHPDDLEKVRAAQLAADVAGTTYDMRHRIVRPDGVVRWVHERARVERDVAGKPIRYIGVTMDVTEEKLAEDSLRASEARNAAVVEAAVDCLIVIDAEGRVTGFNPAAERLFGYRQAEVLGRDLVELIVPDRFHARHRAALRSNLESGDRHYLGRRIEVILHDADGIELSAEVSVSRFEVDGSPSYSTSIRDLSDRDQLAASRARLAEVVDNAPVMLYAYDSEGVITLAAGLATERLLGVEPATAIGLNVFELMSEVPEAIEHLQRGL